MSWKNPFPWGELERRLSGRPGRHFPADDDPPPPPERRPGPVDFGYAELHCHSNFSFLDGASSPEELVAEAARLGLSALALTDTDGFYGVVRFAEAARVAGLPTVFGAELTLGLERRPATPAPDPDGTHLVVLARDPDGYARLSRAVSGAQMAGTKTAPRVELDTLAGLAGGRWAVLTGCRKGAVRRALDTGGPAAAAAALGVLVEAFGREHVLVELTDHGDPLDSTRNDALARLAVDAGVEVVATGNVHYATPERHRLAAALAAVRARRSLDELDGWLPAGPSAHLRSGAEQARRFARYPGAVERAAQLGAACAFDLQLLAPKLPDFPVPPGHTEMSWLRELTERGAARRYGPRAAERVGGAWRQIDHELDMIGRLGFPGYFLTVWDIVQFCRDQNIYCQGRGSAANSAVCYALGITKADAVSLGLLFERFLSPERDGPPDIDLDIESGRREEVIQYVYRRYGRDNAALVANVISYRPRSALRDMGRALGHAPGQLDAWSKQLDAWAPLPDPAAPEQPASEQPTPRQAGPQQAGPQQPDLQEEGPQQAGTQQPGPRRPGPGQPEHDIPVAVLELARQVQGFPRHLGIHPGGMVICDRPVVEVCPVEWATMADRSVLQWDKDDCAAAGLVKFDLLGLGMLSALHTTVDLVAEHHGVEVDLAAIPQEPAVYEMLARADSVGVFQVESRAQMATLPRLRPRGFYDLVVEVALIRPGPIQGGSVHPYIRRRNGTEPITYLHPLLERSLAKTLGVPLFQEQLMQMAVDVAGLTAAEADQLRQAMSAKRSPERMERLRARLYAGMAERGVTGAVADRIYEQLSAFANFGFPESHAVSFAYLVYASAWLKLHYPAAFLAALLNHQPMGFYAPHTLVGDARRHGVVVRGPDVNASAATATLEAPTLETPAVAGGGGRRPEGAPAVRSTAGDGNQDHRGSPAVRLGLAGVRNIGEETAERIAAGRPYASMEDLVRRSGIGEAALEALATAGALGCFGLDRRAALWAAGALAAAGPGKLPGVVVGVEAPQLPGMTPAELGAADVWATGLSPDSFPTQFVRSRLDALGVLPAAALAEVASGRRVTVGGVVTHRQRPATAGGTVFLSLEDETGLVNVICSPGLWTRYRRVARSAAALLVRGLLERTPDGDPGQPAAVNLVADRVDPLPLAVPARSRDFR